MEGKNPAERPGVQPKSDFESVQIEWGGASGVRLRRASQPPNAKCSGCGGLQLMLAGELINRCWFRRMAPG